MVFDLNQHKSVRYPNVLRVWGLKTLKTQMVFDLEVPMFGDVGPQSIGTSHGFPTMGVRKC